MTVIDLSTHTIRGKHRAAAPARSTIRQMTNAQAAIIRETARAAVVVNSDEYPDHLRDTAWKVLRSYGRGMDTLNVVPMPVHPVRPLSAAFQIALDSVGNDGMGPEAA